MLVANGSLDSPACSNECGTVPLGGDGSARGEGGDDGRRHATAPPCLGGTERRRLSAPDRDRWLTPDVAGIGVASLSPVAAFGFAAVAMRGAAIAVIAGMRGGEAEP